MALSMVCWGCEQGVPACACEPVPPPSAPLSVVVEVLAETFARPPTARALAGAGVHVAAPGVACPRCNKRFANTGNLNRHLLTHQGRRRYGCTHCDKTFFQHTHCVIHEQNHCRGRK